MPGAEQRLPSTLKRLVSVVEAALGEVVAAAEGPELFDAVETVRRHMVIVRDGGEEEASAALQQTRGLLRALSSDSRAAVARAYTVYLELVNLCENAYRTHRLRQRWRQETPPDSDPGAHSGAEPPAGARIVWVITAHPTESRSPTSITLMRRAQNLFVEALDGRREPDLAQLKHLLHLVWLTGTHPRHKPTVEDEALHLFSLVDNAILDTLVDLSREGHDVRLRTWVGGDKDGHPGVGPEETATSLNLSRARLLDFVENRIVPRVGEDVALIPHQNLEGTWQTFLSALAALHSVGAGDGRRVGELRAAAEALGTGYREQRGTAHPAISRLRTLLDLFPGLVIPLELREARGCFVAGSAMAGMLHYLKDVARGGNVAWYVQGLVVSMTEAARDLIEAHTLMLDVLGEASLPVIPLFEMPDVLPRAAAILEEALNDPEFGQQPWIASALEVMLGYSDTSKRMGVLSSRLAIHDAMQDIGRWARRRDLRLIFFHGSGGSVGRGGGTVEEQFATWPPGAGHVVKQTLQGEMVERTLATPEILRSQVLKIAANQAVPPAHREPGPVSRRLAAVERATYVEIVESAPFQSLVEKATPYRRLGSLNIGSRPVSRPSGPPGLEKLRAIPWVLCWTQTRYLLHAWLGAGSAWREMREEADDAAAMLPAAARDDPFLRSYLRSLGFTMAKTVPCIWQEYVGQLTGQAQEIVVRLEQERQDALELACRASETGDLLFDRIWLRESIHYRTPMIHPLNLLQIDVLARETLTEEEELLFRETVTGIAAGMLTTG